MSNLRAGVLEKAGRPFYSGRCCVYSFVFRAVQCKYNPNSYGALLAQNLTQQNNLKGNINLLTRLSDQARSRAELSRTAGDRQAFDQWKNQYNQLQQRLQQFRQRLGYLEAQEQQLRGAVKQYGQNAVPRPGSAPPVSGPGTGRLIRRRVWFIGQWRRVQFRGYSLGGRSARRYAARRRFGRQQFRWWWRVCNTPGSGQVHLMS